MSGSRRPSLRRPVIVGLAGETAGDKPPPKPHASFVIAGDDPLQFVPQFRGTVESLPVLTEAARGLGAVNWLPERDQVVRRVPLLLSIAGTLYPSLPLETLRVALNETTMFVRSSGGSSVTAFGQRTGIEHVRVGQTVLPTDGDGELWLRFTRPDARRYISAHRVLDGTLDAKEVAGRDILVGTSAVGLLDLRATPLDSAVPGVEVHAQALEQMLNGDHLSRPPFATGLELVYLVAAGAALAWLIGRARRHRRGGHRRRRRAGRLRSVVARLHQRRLSARPRLSVDRPAARLSRHLAHRLHRHRARAQPRALRLRALRRRAAGRGAGAQSRQAEARRRDARGDGAVRRRARLHQHRRGH